jgi:hypothetical protein
VFDWLFEGRLSVYLLLIGVGVIVAAQWARNGFVVFREERRTKGSTTPRRRLVVLPIVLAVLALLVGVYFLLDRLVETRREQIARKLQEMAAAVRAGDLDRIFSHISERFNVQGMDKATFRNYAQAAMEQGWAEELALWDEQFTDDSGSVVFRAKPKGRRMPEAQFVVRGQFVLDPDGQWRLEGFQVFFPAGDELTLPALR